MAFDFPATPSEGQIFTPPGGPTYTYQAPVWKALGQGQFVYIGDTPPLTPMNGHLWWQSSTGKMFVYYDDGTSKQWVIAAPQGAPGVDGGGALLQKLRNTTRTQMAIPVALAGTWPVSQGVQVLTQPITVKSLTSKLLVRGGFTVTNGAAAASGGGAVYTDLSSNYLGATMGTNNASWNYYVEVIGQPVAHGQPIGTVITAQLRASTNAAANVNATTGGTQAYLEVEEVL